MEYVYGTANRGGVMVENLKTVGSSHTALSGFFGTVRIFEDGTKIEDQCRILEHYKSSEQDGLCYDWHYIDSHYRQQEKPVEGLQEIKEQMAADSAAMGQVQIAAKLYVQKATDIPDEQALEIKDLFLTWEEALAAGKELGANTVLNDGGQLYRVVQAVTPQSHQAPSSAGMLAIYRPIDQTHAGTAEDPIPWVYGMDCTTGNYYTHNGTVYLCKGDMIPCVWEPGSAGLWQWEAVE